VVVPEAVGSWGEDLLVVGKTCCRDVRLDSVLSKALYECGFECEVSSGRFVCLSGRGIVAVHASSRLSSPNLGNDDVGGYF
jgi:hypothetical protein